MKRIIRELKAIALSRPLDCLDWQDGKLELKPLDKIPARSRVGIARIERNTTGIKVVFHDKLKAAELLLRTLGVPSESTDNNLLEKILEACSGPVDFSDIEELEDLYDNGVFIEQGD